MDQIIEKLGKKYVPAWNDLQEDIKQALREEIKNAVQHHLGKWEREILYGKPGGIEPTGILNIEAKERV